MGGGCYWAGEVEQWALKNTGSLECRRRKQKGKRNGGGSRIKMVDMNACHFFKLQGAADEGRGWWAELEIKDATKQWQDVTHPAYSVCWCVVHRDTYYVNLVLCYICKSGTLLCQTKKKTSAHTLKHTNGFLWNELSDLHFHIKSKRCSRRRDLWNRLWLCFVMWVKIAGLLLTPRSWWPMTSCHVRCVGHGGEWFQRGSPVWSGCAGRGHRRVVQGASWSELWWQDHHKHTFNIRHS